MLLQALPPLFAKEAALAPNEMLLLIALCGLGAWICVRAWRRDSAPAVSHSRAE